MNSDLLPGASSNPAAVRAKTFVGVAWLILWRLLTRVIGLGSTLILARVLVPADFGLLGMATAFSASIDALSVLGIQEALVRRRGDDTTIYDTAFTMQLGRSILTAAILVIAAPLASAWFKEPRLTSVLVVLAATSLISGFENIGIIEYRRSLRFDVQFKLLLWPRILQVVVTIALALALKSFWALLWGMFISKVARTVMTYFLHPYRPSLRILEWRELAGFSFWTWATGLASLIWDRCDPFVLGPRLGAANLGLFLIAADTALLPVTEVVAPASDALSTGFAVAQKDGHSSAHLGTKVAATLMLVLTPLVITISCASGDIVEVLLGPKWQAAQPLIAILTWECIFSPFSYSCSTVMVANGHVRHNFLANLIVSLIKLAVLAITISFTSDLVTVASAVSACVAIESVVFVLLLKRAADIDLNIIRGGLLRIIASCAVSLGVLFFLGVGWRPVHTGPAMALYHGASIGFIATLVYLLSILAMWRCSGCGDGPERWAIDLIGPRLSALFVRLTLALNFLQK
jgi:lipopolysaccharide exporter